MKNKLLFSIIIQFIYLNSTACVCELEESMKKDSIFNPENIMKDYPVVFVGKLIKHEWPRLSLYKIIWNFKGLDNEDEIIAIKNNSCNMFDKIGDTILVSGYLNKPEVRFLHQTNCRGTKILRNLDGNYLDYFRRNKHFETNSQDSILKNTIYRSLNHISFLPEVAPKKKNEIKKVEDNLDEDTYSMYIAIGICLILLFFLFKKNIFSNKV